MAKPSTKGMIFVSSPKHAVSLQNVASIVSRIVEETPVFDLHTHLYDAPFGDLLLWGPDELLTYHYLIAEVARTDTSVSPDEFYAMSKAGQAEHIWQKLFVERGPISEARRGVLTSFSALGADVTDKDLTKIRAHFAKRSVTEHIDAVFAAANCSGVVMTNDPLDDAERAAWEAGFDRDPRFAAALRIDPLLCFWTKNAAKLRALGYEVEQVPNKASVASFRRFLDDFSERMDPLYLAVSFADNWRYPETGNTALLINDAILPTCREHDLPFALMVGVRRQVNPALRLAGDGVGVADVGSVERLCAANPDVKFMTTYLSLENQHELAVTARKFPNLMLFGCWWFLNDPSLIEQITRMRLELLGTGFIPQHSDCRILDQLVYKWVHSRQVLAGCLVEKYTMALQSGWPLTEEEIRRDVRDLLSDNFFRFIGREPVV